jgi:cytochrome c553
MARWLRLGAVAAAVLGAVAVLALIAVYIASERLLQRRYVAVPEHLVRPSASALADAPHQARLIGCLSCHGQGLRGNDVFDEPDMGDIIAPNLPAIAKSRTDQQLAAAIRQGIGSDGRPLVVMTSAIFSRLSDEDVSALIAWIRTLPVMGGPSKPLRLSLLGRLHLLKGDMPLQPELARLYRRELPAEVGPNYARGRYMAAINCAECHGPALHGGDRAQADFNPSFGERWAPTPDLAIVGAYDRQKFKRLMRTGVPADGRKLDEMADVAKQDFSHFTDGEIDTLYVYLQERAKLQ